jgi:hypothetical protein
MVSRCRDGKRPGHTMYGCSKDFGASDERRATAAAALDAMQPPAKRRAAAPCPPSRRAGCGTTSRALLRPQDGGRSDAE